MISCRLDSLLCIFLERTSTILGEKSLPITSTVLLSSLFAFFKAATFSANGIDSTPGPFARKMSEFTF